MKKNSSRKCMVCLELKGRQSFHTLNPKGDLHPWCKDCQREHMAANRNDRNLGRREKLKQCCQCDLSFSPTCFHWLKSTGTYHSYCRGCHATYMGLRYHMVKPKARIAFKR